MNNFEKFVAGEMISQADKLIGQEYGDEAEAIFGADMEAGAYLYGIGNCMDFVSVYLDGLQEAVKKYRITTSYAENPEIFIVECIYNTAYDIVDQLGTALFRGERYQNEDDVKEFKEELKKLRD